MSGVGIVKSTAWTLAGNKYLCCSVANSFLLLQEKSWNDVYVRGVDSYTLIGIFR